MANERITETQLNALRHIGTEWTFALDAWHSLAEHEVTSRDLLAAYAMFRVLAGKGLIEGCWDRTRSTTHERMWRLTEKGRKVKAAADSPSPGESA